MPIEIGKIVKKLPQTLNEYETISVKLKCRLCYKNTVFDENVRPYKIIEALKYLLNNSNLYEEHNIYIDPEWLNDFGTSDTSTTAEATNKTTKENKEDNNTSSDEDNENEESPNAPSVNTLLTENTIDPKKKQFYALHLENTKNLYLLMKTLNTSASL